MGFVLQLNLQHFSGRLANISTPFRRAKKAPEQGGSQGQRVLTVLRHPLREMKRAVV
jgi:hypothetical protein